MRMVPASVCFHRALLSLIPAMALSLLIYRSGFGPGGWLVAAAAIVWGLSIYWLWRGSRQLRVEQSSRPKR